MNRWLSSGSSSLWGFCGQITDLDYRSMLAIRDRYSDDGADVRA